MKKLITLLSIFPALLLLLAVSVPASQPNPEGTLSIGGILSPATLTQTVPGGAYHTGWDTHSFVIPPFPDADGVRDDYDLKFSSHFDRQLASGGQNRGTHTHPGLEPSQNYVWLSAHWLVQGTIYQHFAPVSITDWGPTAGGAHLPEHAPEDLADVARRDRSVYWGPSTPGAPGFVWDPGEHDHVTVYPGHYWDLNPGDVIKVKLAAAPVTPQWDYPADQWPMYWEFYFTYSARFEWVPKAN